MDVVPPPVVAAPPVNDGIAGQMAADATLPPAPVPSDNNPATEASAPEPAFATPPDEPTQAPPAGDSPDELIESEVQHENHAPEHAPAPTVPHQSNPATVAVIATVILTLALAGLAVFAYMASQNK
jgi:hypothetical protein